LLFRSLALSVPCLVPATPSLAGQALRACVGQTLSATRRYMATRPLIPVPAAGQRSQSARSPGWKQECAEAARQAATAARGKEIELTRPRDMGTVCDAQLAETSEPKSDNGDWFVLEDLAGDEIDDDPETLAMFSRQFGLDDDSTDASQSVGYWRTLLAPSQPAVPAPKRRPSSSASSTGPSRPKKVCIRGDQALPVHGSSSGILNAVGGDTPRKPAAGADQKHQALPDQGLDLRGLLPECLLPTQATSSNQLAPPANLRHQRGHQFRRIPLQ